MECPQHIQSPCTTVCQGLRHKLACSVKPVGCTQSLWDVVSQAGMLHLVCHPLMQSSCPRCPHDETVTYLNAIGESTSAEFSFQMFRFVGYPEVFLHCRVQLCLPDGPEPCAKVSSLAALPPGWVWDLPSPALVLAASQNKHLQNQQLSPMP